MINGAGILNQRISMDITIHRLVGCEADQSLLLCWLIDRLSSGAMHNDVIIKDNNTWLSTTRQNITSALFKSSKVCRTTTDKLTKRGFINIERGNGGILISLTAKFIKEYQNTSNRSFNEVYNYNSSLILPDISGKLKYSGKTEQWGGDIEEAYAYMMTCLEGREDIPKLSEEDYRGIFDMIMFEKGKALLSNQIYVKSADNLFKYIIGYFHLFYREDQLNHHGFKFDYVWYCLRSVVGDIEVRREKGHDYGQNKFLYTGCMQLLESLEMPFRENLNKYIDWRRSRNKSLAVRYIFSDVYEYLQNDLPDSDYETLTII